MLNRILTRLCAPLGLMIILTACATEGPPTVYLKIESVAADYLQSCPLVFSGRTTQAVEAGWRAKSDCDDADKAAARAELEKLAGAGEG